MKDQVENIEAIEEGTISQDSLKPASRPVTDDPKSRVEILKTMIGAMAEMPKKDLVKWFDQTMSQFGPGKDYGVGDKSAANQSSIDMKGGSGPKTKDAMPKLSVKEDVEEMFNGHDLSEDFKEKASTLFEAAIQARIITETARLEEEFDEKLEEAVAEINEELTSKIDSYLDYVVEQWMEDNEVAIESTLRNELAEEFIEGLKGLFSEHYIDVPQEKIDVIESLASKVEELEAMVSETLEENNQLKDALVGTEKKEVFESFLDDLALTQQEKFKALAEGIDFDGDLETYAKKLSVIKENYFGVEKKAPTSTNIVEETFEGDTKDTNTVNVDPTMSFYAQAISRTLKK
jgi:hypothetical protein